MEQHYQTSERGKSEPRCEGDAPDTRTLKILQRYAAGEISSRQAAQEIGPEASEHDVFAGILAAQLPLPEPAPEDVAREVAALRVLYGQYGPRPRT
ncbi:MAG: hypothetical protein HQL02_03965 [Nitrospirae bacterium]|nr:hypothetical protein [Nitrospirota bacterium]